MLATLKKQLNLDDLEWLTNLLMDIKHKTSWAVPVNMLTDKKGSTPNPLYQDLSKALDLLDHEIKRKLRGPFTIGEAIATNRPWREIGTVEWHRLIWDYEADQPQMQFSIDGLEWTPNRSSAIEVTAPHDLVDACYELMPQHPPRGKK